MVSVPSAGNRVSRWTPAICPYALVNFGLAQLLIVAGASWPAAPKADGVLVTVILGLTFALALTIPALAWTLSPVIASGVECHVLAGIGGWFTLTAIGVSYELLPMFMLAPHDRGVWGKSVFMTACAGLVAALVAGFALPHLPGTVSRAAEQASRVLIALAIILYLIDVARIYHDRRRRLIELHNRAAVGAFVSLGVALAIAVASAIVVELKRAAPARVFLLIFGWLSGLGLSQLYKIIPFLSWLSQFGRRLGTGPIPRVQDLVNARRAVRMFSAYYIAVAAGTAAALFGVAWLVRASVFLMFAATVLLGHEYWRAWEGYYPQRQVAAAVDKAAASQPIPNHADDRTRASHA